MPPRTEDGKTDALPLTLRPYAALGLELKYDGGSSASGRCPFCGRDGRFNVTVDKGLWRCPACNEGPEKGKPNRGGNLTTFLRTLWRVGTGTPNAGLATLAEARGLLFSDTLEDWGVCDSPVNGEWLVPGFSPEKSLMTLYRYVPVGRGWKLLALPESKHWLHGVNLFDPRKQEVYFAEGVWDAMVLWEALSLARRSDIGRNGHPAELVQASTVEESLLRDINVVATPGSAVFREEWASLLAGKRVTLFFDNDHPKTRKGGREDLGAGMAGMRRLVQILSRSEHRPLSVHYLSWGEGDDHTHDPSLASGYDLRDHLTQSDDEGERVNLLRELLHKVRPCPKWWVTGVKPAPVPASTPSTNGVHLPHVHVNGESNGTAPAPIPEDGTLPSQEEDEDGSVSLECLPCSDWRSLVNSWKKAHKWSHGQDCALSVMLATVVSTPMAGDQLWVKIVSAPSSGKTVLCEAVSVNKQWVVPKSTIRGFHSGYKTDKHGAEDCSLIAKLKNKTLVTKDGDTLLQSPNVQQILSEARDIYDRVARTDYRHGLSRNYVGHPVTWILSGTASLHALDSSELGERFLDCVIVDRMDDELEMEIALKKAFQADRDMRQEVDGTELTMDGPEMTRAKQLTGGYVGFLRDNFRDLLRSVDTDPDKMEFCARLAKFVSYMRTRQSKTQKEEVQRELCFRLTSQLTRLANCLAVVMGKKEWDGEVMRRTKKVAMDTSRGRSIRIANVLYQEGRTLGCAVPTLSAYTQETESDLRNMLRFLGKLEVVEVFSYVDSAHPRGRPRYRLTPRFHDLYQSVMGSSGV